MKPRCADALQLEPYDALMEQYDPGNRAADIAPVFDTLKTFLKDFVPKALAVQEERLPNGRSSRFRELTRSKSSESLAWR
jgi:Zn-dependent M32 family carboxypeptidase